MYLMNVLEAKSDTVQFFGFENLSDIFYFRPTDNGGILASTASNSKGELKCTKANGICRDSDLIEFFKSKGFSYGNFHFFDNAYITAFDANKLASLDDMLQSYREERHLTPQFPV